MSSSLNSPPTPGRVLTVAATVSLALAGATWSLVTTLTETTAVVLGPGRTSVEELVVALSAAAALALLFWVTLGLLASVVAALPGPLGAVGRRMRDSVAPEAVRRWAAVLLGVVVVSACAPGGAAASEVVAVRTVAAEPTSEAPAPLWGEPVPGWSPSTSTTSSAAPPVPAPSASVPPTSAPPPTAPATATPADAASAPEWVPTPVRRLPPVSLTAPRPPASDQPLEVTVRRGDTLWDLAAAHLTPGATDAEVAASWQRWYTGNRDVIGSDPDLILPGQVLRVPTSPDATLAEAAR